MKIVFIGPTLLTKACIEAVAPQYEILALFTLDKDSGEKKCRYTSFDVQSKKYGFQIFEVAKVSAFKNIKLIKSLEPDLIVEAGWSEIISQEIIDIPSKGAIGIHGAILPDFPGQASMNWALIQGKEKWGVTLMHLDRLADQGDIIATRHFDITLDDDIKSVHKKSDQASAKLLEDFLPLLEQNKAPRLLQDKTKSIRTKSRKAADGIIDWNKSAAEIYNWIRAQTAPFPGAFTLFQGKNLSIWKADPEHWDADGFSPGQVIDIEKKGIKVKTANTAIRITSVSYENRKFTAYDFAVDFQLKKGYQFD